MKKNIFKALVFSIVLALFLGGPVISLMAWCPTGGGIWWPPQSKKGEKPKTGPGMERPKSGPGIAPYMWDQMLNNPTLTASILPMWENWWIRNRLYYLPFKEPIVWVDSTITGDTTPVTMELQKKVIAILIESVKNDKHPMVRSDAALALAKARDRSAIPVLQEVFETDKDFDVRNVAHLALGILGDESAINNLKTLKCYISDTSYKSLPCAYGALALGYIKNTKSIEILKEILDQNTNARSETQCSALLSLGNIQEKSLIPFISNILHDSSRDKSVRAYAALALGKIKDRSTLPELKKALTDQDPSIRSSVVIAIGLTKSSESKDDLIKVLSNDRTSEVRAYAVIALAQLGDKSAYSIISKIAKKGDYTVQNMSILALGILGNEDALPELRDILEKKGDPVIYRATIVALGLLKDKISVPKLIKIVDTEDSDPITWAYAIQSLGMIGDTQAVSVLEKAFQKVQARPDLAISAYNNLTIALTLLGKRQEVLSILYEQLKNESLIPELKWSVLFGIAYIGNKTSIEPLVNFYKEQNDNWVRRYVVFALGYILDKDKINPLYAITADNNFNIWLRIIDHILMSRPD